MIFFLAVRVVHEVHFFLFTFFQKWFMALRSMLSTRYRSVRNLRRGSSGRFIYLLSLIICNENYSARTELIINFHSVFWKCLDLSAIHISLFSEKFSSHCVREPVNISFIIKCPFWQGYLFAEIPNNALYYNQFFNYNARKVCLL